MLKTEIILSLIWTIIFQNTLCTRLERIALRPANILTDFYAYRHISIIHFEIPENTVVAEFKFTAKEDKTGGIGSCPPKNVSLYLKSGSIPLVSPDGSKIEAKLMKGRRRYSTINMESDSNQHILNIDAPPPGDWYAIAFRSWTDPENGKIIQQGLGVACDTVLDAEFLAEIAPSVVLTNWKQEYNLHLNKTNDSSVLRCILPLNIETAELSLTSSCGEKCRILFHVTAEDNLAGVILNATSTKVPFKPFTSDFHFLTFRLLSGDATDISLRLVYDAAEAGNQVTVIDTTRKSLSEFFVFDYEHLRANETKPSPLNLTAETLSVLSFEIGRVYDVGGTLTIGLKLPNDEEKEKNVVIVGCVSLGYYSNVTVGAGCERAKNTTVADIYTNATNSAYVHVPFPEPGTWHLSLRAFCLEDKCPCAKSCLNSSNPCESCECMTVCSSRVEVMISSSPCIEGRCGLRGKCMHYMSGGFVFAACHCVNGYRGFDCADDAYVIDNSEILVRVLMLTLSNLAFIGSVYIAIRREYFTEAIVYTAVMFFSTFYHACEAGENEYSFCIMRLSVLQFCDFFNALLSIWVTLVAMAAFGPKLTAFCQVAGAVVIAMAAEMDRTALWVFLLPAVTGIALIGISWGSRCRRKKTVRYPSRPYRLLYFPAGLLLVSSGLVCYAFLQTRRNYHILHSLWHICVALGVVLLLPKRQFMK